MTGQRKGPQRATCRDCGRRIEYYASLDRWWCGERGHREFSAPPPVDAATASRGGHGQASPPNAEPVAVLVPLADVRPERVRWLWPCRIPLGKLTVWAGPPGVGKSFSLLDIGARVSRGASLPDGDVAPLGDVVLLTAEDGLADTVRPRLDLMGADSRRVLALTMVREGQRERMFSLEDHLPLLEKAVIEKGAILAIIDPVLAYTGRADSYKESEVRGLLAPLAAMAERTGCAVVGVIHLNKRGGEHSPLNRITASGAFVAQARSVLLVAVDPDDEAGRRRILAPVKMNLCAHPPSLAFHFGEDGGLAWEGSIDKNAADLLAPPADKADRGALAEAKDFLLDLLADGPVEAEEGLRQARKAVIAPRTLDRAKKELGVKSRREGFGLGARYYWELPTSSHGSPSSMHIEGWRSMDASGTVGLQEYARVGDPCSGVCPHRPPGEAEDRWAHGDGGPDLNVCACCGAPVRPNLWADGLCPACRNGRPVKAGSGHLLRLALDLGAKEVGHG